jgi:tetratricopeptide (TPR) repeat protein
MVSAACLALGLPYWTAGGTGVAVGIDKRFVSERACDFIAAANIKGHGFNHFHLGGYMLWRFWPDRDRLPFATIHPEAMRREDRLGYELARTEPGGWKALDQRHHFDYALLYRRQLGGDVLLDELDKDNDFTLVFLDDNAAVFVRWNGPLAPVAMRYAYQVVPAGRGSIAAFGRECERDSTLRERARNELARQAAASEFNAMANSVRATLDLMDGRLDSAGTHLRQAMTVDRDLPRAHERLGMIALSAGRPAEAVKELKQAVAEKPVPAGVHFALGNAYARVGDAAKAIDQYRAELRVDPGNAAASDSLRTLGSEH